MNKCRTLDDHDLAKQRTTPPSFFLSATRNKNAIDKINAINCPIECYMNHNVGMFGRSVKQRSSLIYGKLETTLVLDGLTEELNLADLALSEDVLMLISPFHECELDSFITVNSDEVAIFIFIT